MENTTKCAQCPLRKLDLFQPFSASELSYVDSLKTGELKVEAGVSVLEEDTKSPHVFTVLSGWGLRQKSLPDGRRQVLNFIMPGDLIGLQAAMFEALDHSVEALTQMTLCVFQRADVLNLFHDQASLGHTMVWHAARSERLLDAALLSVGQCTARERIARGLLILIGRARRLGLAERDGSMPVPIRQSDLADALGLSVVHANRTIKRMSNDGLLSWKAGRISIKDEKRLKEIAQMAEVEPTVLPLI